VCISRLAVCGRALPVEHDRYYGVLHQVTQCFAEMLWSTGQAAEERRSRVLPSLLTDPVGVPDVIGLGPESPVDEGARRLFFVKLGPPLPEQRLRCSGR
jgi:hypothetical protein